MLHLDGLPTNFCQLARRRNNLWACGTFVAAALLILLGPYESRAETPVSVLHAFNVPTEGWGGESELIQASDGNFYGAKDSPDTAACFFCGSIYRVTPTGVLTILHAFTGSDGWEPHAGLIQASNGYLYGSTDSGGCCTTLGLGVIFRIGLDGTFTVLHEFSGTDGAQPYGALVQGADGYLYGTARAGGSGTTSSNWWLGGGTAFRMSLDGTLTTIHDFAGGALDAADPESALVEYGGAFYGVSAGGGTLSGTIYRMTPDGDVTVLRSFSTFDGDYSYVRTNGLVLSSDGNFYGTTQNSDNGLTGLFYRLSPSGEVTVLREFPPTVDAPTTTLIEARDGAFYAPSFISGAIFRLTREGAVTTIDRFAYNSPEGTTVLGALVQGSDGKLYGTTGNGSAGGGGCVFRLSLSREAVNSDFDGDGISELTVYRPSNGTWYIRYSSLDYSVASYREFQWGLPGDIPLMGDFDGDGRTDLAAYRPSNGTWYIRYSSLGYSVASYREFQWGLPGDTPLVGDFDGDGQTDLAVWRSSNGTWYIRYSSLAYSVASYREIQWGLPGDVPLAGDFDGDGTTDLAVYRPSNGTWYIRYSSLDYSFVTYGEFQWGLPGDVPMIVDVDGDGRTDLAVYRPSIGGWFIRYSSQSYSVTTYSFFQWGLPGDILADGDESRW